MSNNFRSFQSIEASIMNCMEVEALSSQIPKLTEELEESLKFSKDQGFIQEHVYAFSPIRLSYDLETCDLDKLVYFSEVAGLATVYPRGLLKVINEFQAVDVYQERMSLIDLIYRSGAYLERSVHTDDMFNMSGKYFNPLNYFKQVDFKDGEVFLTSDFRFDSPNFFPTNPVTIKFIKEKLAA